MRFLNTLRKRFGRSSKNAGREDVPAISPSQPNPGKSEARRHDEQIRRKAQRHSHRRSVEPEAAAEKTASKRTSDSEQPFTADQFVVPVEEGKSRFHDFDLPDELMHAVADLDFKYCTPVQAQTLPHALKGRNVAAQAQTGTGKTAAFLMAIFTRFLRSDRQKRKPGTPRALVLAPTRELVVQLARDSDSLTRHTNLRCLAVYGGMDLEKQARQLQRGPVDLIAATPGRLLDFCNRSHIDLGQVEVLVIDEADRMLDMGFIPDVRRIIRKTPPKERRQTLLFSATLSDDVMRLAANWMPDPEVVKIEPESLAAETVEQKVYPITARDKFTVLYNLLDKHHMSRVLVFANRRETTRRLTEELDRYGISAELLSGDVPQNKRLRILEGFRGGSIRVLVATDVAARGLHVEDVTHVINYDFPYEPEGYVHRIGRTGRAGAEGTAISFACEDESFIIPEIEELIGRSLPCVVPEPELLEKLPRPSRPARRSDRREGGNRSGGGGHGGSSRGSRSRRSSSSGRRGRRR